MNQDTPTDTPEVVTLMTDINARIRQVRLDGPAPMGIVDFDLYDGTTARFYFGTAAYETAMQEAPEAERTLSHLDDAFGINGGDCIPLVTWKRPA